MERAAINTGNGSINWGLQMQSERNKKLSRFSEVRLSVPIKPASPTLSVASARRKGHIYLRASFPVELIKHANGATLNDGNKEVSRRGFSVVSIF